jgi:glycosyltransferase involved in cell wall biosynthesis
MFALSIPGYSALLDTLIYRYWLPAVLPKINNIITISQQSKQDIMHYLRPSQERIRVIPYGVAAKFQPIPEKEARAHLQERLQISQRYVLYVGALTERKNIQRTLQAFARIAPTLPDISFVLTGPRSWKPTMIETLIAELGIQERVFWTGPLTDTDLPALYSAAELFVFPSLYEGFGLPVLEAMACGAPVVTSNTSSLPEVAGVAAIQVDPYNIDALAAAMQRVLTDPHLAAEMRQKGLSQAQKFSWQRAAQATLAVYEEVAQNNR